MTDLASTIFRCGIVLCGIAFACGCEPHSGLEPDISLPDSLYSAAFMKESYAPSDRGTHVSYRYAAGDYVRRGLHEWPTRIVDPGYIRIEFNRADSLCSGEYRIQARPDRNGRWRAAYVASGYAYVPAPSDSSSTQRRRERWATGNVPARFATEFFPLLDEEDYVYRAIGHVSVVYDPRLAPSAFFDSIRAVPDTPHPSDGCPSLVTLNPAPSQ